MPRLGRASHSRECYNRLAMTLRNVERIESSIVLLSGAEASLNINREALEKVIRDPVIQGVGQPPIQIEITSLRDQILIRLVDNKFIFEDKSDDSPATGKLPEAVYKFISMLNEQDAAKFRAYGLNFKVEFDARGDSSASEIIAERYVNVNAISERGGISVQGAGLRLYYEHSNGAKCELKVEPRLGAADAPRFFAQVNYHFDLAGGDMPPLDAMKTSYLGLLPQFEDLLDKLFAK